MEWNHDNWREHPRYGTRAEARAAGIVPEVENRAGMRIGLGACGVCGDNWLWKTHHTLRFGDGSGAFPYCEECHAEAPLEKRDAAIDDLCSTWASCTDPDKLEKERAEMKEAARRD